MKRNIVCALFAASIATSVYAEDVTNRDQLLTYLKTHIPDGQEIAYTYKSGDTLSIGNRHNSCMSDRTLKQFPLPTYIAVRDRLIQVKVTKEFTGYRLIGSTDPACEYVITGFDPSAIKRRGIPIEAGSTKLTSLKLPIVKQRILGVTEENFQGHISISDTTCDVSFRAWFESTQPSKFAQFYASELKTDYQYKHVFSKEFQTSTWCLQRHYDGSLKWKYWSRL